MISACVLGSGSKGNAVFVNIDGVSCLIDAGLSGKTIVDRLSLIGRNLKEIKYIFLSHAHSDHNNLGPLRKKKGFNAQVVSMEENADIRLFPPTFSPVPNNPDIDDMDIMMNVPPFMAFPLHHDVPCLGFTFNDHDGNKLAYITDTDCVPEEAFRYLWECSIVIIECNHNVDLLIESPYPVETQERVFETHMRNEQSGEALNMMAWPGLKYIVCYHISQNCNRWDLIKYETYSNVRHEAPDCEIICTRQDEVSKQITVM